MADFQQTTGHYIPEDRTPPHTLSELKYICETVTSIKGIKLKLASDNHFTILGVATVKVRQFGHSVFDQYKPKLTT
jgi:hypothetical protein